VAHCPIQAATAGPSRARGPTRGGTVVTDARRRLPTVPIGHPFGRAKSSWMDSSWSVVAGSSLNDPGPSRCGADAKSSGLSSSEDRGLRVSRPYAWSRRNCAQVGPTRRGVGPRPPRRSTVAMVVADTSIPSFRSSPLIRG
jgi:hypothetical protein